MGKPTPTDSGTPLRFGPFSCVLRPLRCGDEETLRSFFASHTADTIYQRYGYQVAEMTPQRAFQLVNIDPSRDCALAVFELTPENTDIVGVGRYCLDPDERGAELAFVVHEARRGLGIATALLRDLVRIARERGLARVWAQVQPDNGPMLAVFRKNRFAFSPGGEGMIRADLSLERKPTSTASGRRRRAP
jgi:ribosomal protein S18 acetylase RimI-like enzyme